MGVLRTIAISFVVLAAASGRPASACDPRTSVECLISKGMSAWAGAIDRNASRSPQAPFEAKMTSVSSFGDSSAVLENDRGRAGLECKGYSMRWWVLDEVSVDQMDGSRDYSQSDSPEAACRKDLQAIVRSVQKGTPVYLTEKSVNRAPHSSQTRQMSAGCSAQ